MNYQKIDIHIGPTIAIARLENKRLCQCGMLYIKKDVPIGTAYRVDLRSVRWVKFQCKGCGKEFPTRLIDVWDELLIPHWFPLECLDLDAVIPLAPLPLKWEPVANGLVAPAHAIPKGTLYGRH